MTTTEQVQKEKKKRRSKIRMVMVLELKAIIERCSAIRKNRINKTITAIFDDRKTVAQGPTIRELAFSFNPEKVQNGEPTTDSCVLMRRRLQKFRACKDNKSIVPYPVKNSEGLHVHYSHQTKREYKVVQKMRTDVKDGSDRIEDHMITILSQSKVERERAAKSEKAEVENLIIEGHQQNGKRRKKRNENYAE